MGAAALTQGPSSGGHRTYPRRNRGIRGAAPLGMRAPEHLVASLPALWLQRLGSWRSQAAKNTNPQSTLSVEASGFSLLLRPSGNPALRSPAPGDAGKRLVVATRRAFPRPTFNPSKRWTIRTARRGEPEILLYCWFNIN